ncbi:MAG: HAMP domain-containing histidine kinase [Synechococcaceae cyanobacterium SM2_3_1]|nr:HAMP domain-containing histidine kinase [Synechococcaceae cyanobacterium SM2_3_1]
MTRVDISNPNSPVSWEDSHPAVAEPEGAAPAWIPTQQVATLLHELRNPLTTLRTLARLLQKRLPPEDPNAWIGKTIEQECHHLQGLLYQFEQETATASPPALVLQSLAPTGFVESLIPAFRALAEAQHLSLHLHLEPDPPDQSPLALDPLALRQVLGNLVDNACKYTPAGGSLWFSLYHREEEVMIEIADSGYGIAAENLQHIFEPYYRAHLDQPGHGLGLAISASLVYRMGGTIEVSSTPGQGSCFQLHFPRQTVKRSEVEHGS